MFILHTLLLIPHFAPARVRRPCARAGTLPPRGLTRRKPACDFCPGRLAPAPRRNSHAHQCCSAPPRALGARQAPRAARFPALARALRRSRARGRAAAVAPCAAGLRWYCRIIDRPVPGAGRGRENRAAPQSAAAVSGPDRWAGAGGRRSPYGPARTSGRYGSGARCSIGASAKVIFGTGPLGFDYEMAIAVRVAHGNRG